MDLTNPNLAIAPEFVHGDSGLFREKYWIKHSSRLGKNGSVPNLIVAAVYDRRLITFNGAPGGHRPPLQFGFLILGHCRQNPQIAFWLSTVILSLLIKHETD
jgi:hypothetical protein